MPSSALPSKARAVRSPTGPLAAVFVLVLAVIVLVVGSTWFSEQRAGNITEERVALSANVERLLYYDEALTMTARLAAASGKSSYEPRYQRLASEYDRLVAGTLRLVKDPEAERRFAQSKRPSIALFDLEAQAFDLVRRGQRDRAVGMLENREYQRQKRLYAEALNGTLARFGDVGLEGKRSTERLSLLNLLLGLLAAIGVAAGGIWVVRATGRWARQRERALSEVDDLSRRNESILNSAGEGIYGIDTDGRTTFANAAATELTGYSPAEMIGREQHTLIHHTKADGSPYPAEQCPVTATLVEGGSHRAAEDLYWRKDGTSFAVEVTATPIKEDGRVTGAVVVFRDITERREVDRMKGEFTSVVSHELRTPLTSIRGSLGLLAGGATGEMPERAQRMLEIAVSNTDRLVRLITDILDVERMESGQVVMESKEVALAEVLGAAEGVAGPMACAAAVHLDIEPYEARLWADADRLTQALTNLLSNAIKFSPPGGRVSVSARPSGAEVLIEVSDEGRGIPPEKLEKIFERFQQVDGSDSRKKGGTGLGLPISRSIVHQHGGRIWAESQSGEGSSFFLTLPVLVEQDLGGTANGDGRGVIVCDDDPSIRHVVAELVAQRGYRAVPAASGAEAIELAISERPEAILLDLLMPEMSGWETATALKERPETQDIPILVLSVLPTEEQAGLPVSVEGWVEKPIEEASLFAALDRALVAHGEISSVLIVEDDLDLGRVLSEIFRRQGVAAAHAQTGREAIRESQRLEPDLLVLDLGLPDGDGFSVVDWLREHERLGAVPIIVYTAHDLSEEERARLGPQTEVFLKGHLSPDEFARRVLDLLDHMTTQPVGV